MDSGKNRKSPIGKRLREARLIRDISQKELGILAGIDEFSSSARINQYERDKHVPDYSTARLLTRALGIPVTYLYADEDDLARLVLAYESAPANVRSKVKKLLEIEGV